MLTSIMLFVILFAVDYSNASVPIALSTQFSDPWSYVNKLQGAHRSSISSSLVVYRVVIPRKKISALSLKLHEQTQTLKKSKIIPESCKKDRACLGVAANIALAENDDLYALVLARRACVQYRKQITLKPKTEVETKSRFSSCYEFIKTPDQAHVYLFAHPDLQRFRAIISARSPVKAPVAQLGRTTERVKTQADVVQADSTSFTGRGTGAH